MVFAVVKSRCLDQSGVIYLFNIYLFECKKPSRSQRGRVVTGHRIWSSARAPPTMRQRKAFIRNPSCPLSPQHLTGVSAALRHSLLSSLPFHQNIADEVLSSINHSAAPLHSPSINQQACRPEVPGLLVLSLDVHLPPNTSKTGMFLILMYFCFRRQAGFLTFLRQHTGGQFSKRKSGLSRRERFRLELAPIGPAGRKWRCRLV